MTSKRCILMKTSMLVKCEKCGYENFPQHRFCGMCAAELRLPGPAGTQPAPAARRVPAVAQPRATEVVPKQANGPSFLSLGNEPADTRSVSYLLEDEPAPSHRGKYFLSLMLLLVALAVVGWHWREDLGSLVSRFSGRVSGNAHSNSPAPDSTSSTPPGNSAAGTQVEKPGTGASGQVDTEVPGTQGQTSPPAAPAPVAGTDSAPPQEDQSQPSNQSQASDSASPPSAAKTDDSEEAASQTSPVHKAPKARAQPATTAATQAASLEAEGEKYLYGNGVPENCTRARTNLLAAAQRSNAQAQNVLGTMYATGHCATRDLPTAYRWFSRSLRKDPSNSRIEQDLKVLWNQMTPEERQLALRDQR
jgi:hypothetical protein